MILWRRLARMRINAMRKAERKWLRAQVIKPPKQDDRDWQGKFERTFKDRL